MPETIFKADMAVLARMKSQRQYRDKSIVELISLIRIGMEILEQDERIFNEQGLLRSHYHLATEEKEAMCTAGHYRIMKTLLI